MSPSNLFVQFASEESLHLFSFRLQFFDALLAVRIDALSTFSALQELGEWFHEFARGYQRAIAKDKARWVHWLISLA